MDWMRVRGSYDTLIYNSIASLELYRSFVSTNYFTLLNKFFSLKWFGSILPSVFQTAKNYYQFYTKLCINTFKIEENSTYELTLFSIT